MASSSIAAEVLVHGAMKATHAACKLVTSISDALQRCMAWRATWAPGGRSLSLWVPV